MPFVHSDPRFSGWRKSTRSDGGSNCVQVGRAVNGSFVGVCDSKAGPTGPVIAVSLPAWARFVSNFKAVDLR